MQYCIFLQNIVQILISIFQYCTVFLSLFVKILCANVEKHVQLIVTRKIFKKVIKIREIPKNRFSYLPMLYELQLIVRIAYIVHSIVHNIMHNIVQY